MSLPVRRSVDLYYDVISPHAWIAFELLSRYKDTWNVDVNLKPFSVSEVTKRSSSGDPETKYSNLEKLGKCYNMPLKTPQSPDSIQKGTVPAIKLLMAVSQVRPDLTAEVSRSLWTRMWSKDEDITQRKSLMQVGKNLGLTEQLMEDLLRKTKERYITYKLKDLTETAVVRGIHKAPTIVIKDQGTVGTTHLLADSESMQTNLDDIFNAKH